MLDARFVRDNPDEVRAALAARGAAWDVDGFLALDASRRELIGAVEALQARRNETSKAIGGLMKEGRRDEVEAAKDEVRTVNEEIAAIESRMSEADAQTREMLLTIPNLPDASVPCGADESENVEVRRWGTPPDFAFEPKPH
jgi:seryl-tRNA synthetase